MGRIHCNGEHLIVNKTFLCVIWPHNTIICLFLPDREETEEKIPKNKSDYFKIPANIWCSKRRAKWKIPKNKSDYFEIPANIWCSDSPCHCLLVTTQCNSPPHCQPQQFRGVCTVHMTVQNIWVWDTVLWKGLWLQWLMWCTQLYNYLGSRKSKTVLSLIDSFNLTLGAYFIRWSCDRNFQSADRLW